MIIGKEEYFLCNYIPKEFICEVKQISVNCVILDNCYKSMIMVIVIDGSTFCLIPNFLKLHTCEA